MPTYSSDMSGNDFRREPDDVSREQLLAVGRRMFRTNDTDAPERNGDE